jgi:hypothetical protein
VDASGWRGASINLVLEGEDGADAAVDGVGDARLRLVADGAGRVPAQRHGHPRLHLRHVAGAEHLVHGRELRRAGAGAGPVLPHAAAPEVRRENAPRHAPPPQELARAARRPGAPGRRLLRGLSLRVGRPCRRGGRGSSARALAGRLHRSRHACAPARGARSSGGRRGPPSTGGSRQLGRAMTER